MERGQSTPIPSARDETGNIFVAFAILLPLLLMFCAIAIDVGYWWANAKRTQIAADACALAAARDLPQTWSGRPDCMFEGVDYALTNLPNEGKADEPRHRSTSVTSPYNPEGAKHPPANYVEAKVTVTVETFFGRIIGFGYIDITRRAVAEKQPPKGDMAIYAHDDDCGFSLKFNGEDHNVEGGVHGNGAWQQDGEDFYAGSASYVNGCSPPHPDLEPGETSFGEGPSPVPEQDWPEWFKRSDFTCDVGNPSSDMQISADFTVLNGTYCADEFTISGRQITGKITVVANRITVNNRDHTFTPNQHDVLFFTPPNATPTPPNDDDEQSNYVCDPNPALQMTLNGENYHWEGIIMSPCGRITFNGQDAIAGASHLLGQIIAFEVEINGRNFNMTGTGDPTGDFQLALFE